MSYTRVQAIRLAREAGRVCAAVCLSDESLLPLLEVPDTLWQEEQEVADDFWSGILEAIEEAEAKACWKKGLRDVLKEKRG